VKIPASPRFEEERRRFAFEFTCEACAHFVPTSEVCGHGFPTDEHRDARYDGVSGAAIVFCKEWELA